MAKKASASRGVTQGNTTSRNTAVHEGDLLVKLIETDWRDLHHSRNQDWKIWITIGGIIVAIASLEEARSTVADCDRISFVQLMASSLGAIVCTVGAMITRHHGKLHAKKTARISVLEAELQKRIGNSVESQLIRAIPYNQMDNTLDNKLTVSGVMFATYSMLAFNFVLWPLWLIPYLMQCSDEPFTVAALLGESACLFLVAQRVYAEWREQWRNAIARHIESPSRK